MLYIINFLNKIIWPDLGFLEGSKGWIKMPLDHQENHLQVHLNKFTRHDSLTEKKPQQPMKVVLCKNTQLIKMNRVMIMRWHDQTNILGEKKCDTRSESKNWGYFRQLTMPVVAHVKLTISIEQRHRTGFNHQNIPKTNTKKLASSPTRTTLNPESKKKGCGYSAAEK